METIESAIQEQVRTVGKTQCSECNRYFVGVSAFEAHQVSDKTAKFGIRCLSDKEMQAKGFQNEKRRVRSRVENKPVTELHDVWYSVVSRERLAHLWAKDEDDSEDGLD